MSYEINDPRAQVGEYYTCEVAHPEGFEPERAIVDGDAQVVTLYYLANREVAADTFTWQIGVKKVDENENDTWEFIVMESQDGGVTYSVAKKKKPVMMATTGGGGGDDKGGVVVRSTAEILQRIRNGRIEIFPRVRFKQPWWSRFHRSGGKP